MPEPGLEAEGRTWILVCDECDQRIGYLHRREAVLVSARAAGWSVIDEDNDRYLCPACLDLRAPAGPGARPESGGDEQSPRGPGVEPSFSPLTRAPGRPSTDALAAAMVSDHDEDTAPAAGPGQDQATADERYREVCNLTEGLTFHYSPNRGWLFTDDGGVWELDISGYRLDEMPPDAVRFVAEPARHPDERQGSVGPGTAVDNRRMSGDDQDD